MHHLTHHWGRRIAMVLPGVLALWLAAPSPGEAAVEGRACQPEPTEMLIEYGDLINCAIDRIGDEDTFRFSGASGETIRLQIARSGAGQACFQLFDADGGSVDVRHCAVDYKDLLLTQTGTYSIVINENSFDQTARYALALERIDPPSPAALPINHSGVINNLIDGVGDADVFFFKGERGDTVRIQVTGLRGDRACFRSYAPDGIVLDITRCSNATYQLEQTGTYTIVVVALAAADTAQYSLALACISGVCPDTNRQAISGCIARSGAPFSQRRVRLTQANEPTKTALTDIRGCYEFASVVAGKAFQVHINSRLVGQ